MKEDLEKKVKQASKIIELNTKLKNIEEILKLVTLSKNTLSCIGSLECIIRISNLEFDIDGRWYNNKYECELDNIEYKFITDKLNKKKKEKRNIKGIK